jgi:hypothetical protein
VQFAYFVGNIDAEEVMNLKSSQRFRDHCWAENTRDASPVPEASAKSVKNAFYSRVSGARLRQIGRIWPRVRKLARFLLFKIRLPGEPENHPSVAHEWRETEERAP